ncbi:hypothetical protein N7474_004647 [Penicillium riverlandense]|uniref:uncharacterized protein n=1 Tax=Penicillium riverlandense TaxID=1903569 RepID=UPI00254906E2|nr:uncharacterized protein N7474_004647 [Penicillium riverlandense]KAJ5819056.1 hypothetical protein N7474_004647 [Penicillium riverlandense]
MGDFAPNWPLVNVPRENTPSENAPIEINPIENVPKETEPNHKGKGTETEPGPTTSDGTLAQSGETSKPDPTTTTTTTTNADKASPKGSKTVSDESQQVTSEIPAPGTDGTTVSTQTQTADGLLTYTGTIEPTSISASALTSTSTSAPTQNSATDGGSSSSGVASTKTKIAIAVPVGVVGLAIILAFIILGCRRSKRRQRANRSLHNMAQPTTSTLLPGPGSTSQLMAAGKLSSPEPAAVPIRQQNFSVPTAPQSRDASPRSVPAALTPGSARDLSSASNQDLGIPAGAAAAGVAVTGEHRRSTSGLQRSYEAMRGTTPSSRSPPLPSPQSQPRVSESSDPHFVLRRGPTQRSGVSEVSDGIDGGERDLDDMSSVSSFDEGSPRSPRGPNRFLGR